MVRIGFTGSRIKMNEAQAKHFIKILKSFYKATEFHHGDCIGSDKEAHKTVRNTLKNIKIHIHPPNMTILRARCEGDVMYPTTDYLTRNGHIVDAVDLMIATPDSMEEKIRSGTWSTIRYAKSKNKQLYILFPDGSIEKSEVT